MSSFAATLTQNLRQQYQGKLDSFELRDTNAGALNLFRRQSNSPMSILSSSDIEAIKKSMGNTVQIPVINFQNVSISNVRTCEMYTGGPESALVTLTFVTYAFGFMMVPSQFYNNDIKYQEAFNKQLTAYLIQLKKEMDQDAVDYLEANKNAYFPAAITAFYPFVGDALRITQAQKSDFYNQMTGIVETMDFGGTPNVVANPAAVPIVAQLQAQGTNNATNTAFQFANFEWFISNRVTNGSGVQSTHYLVADNVLGFETRVDPDAETRQRIGEFKTWDKVRVPIVDLDMALYYQQDCTDASAIQSAGLSHLTRAKIESFEYSVDAVYISAYNSSPSTRYNPIIKAEILTT